MKLKFAALAMASLWGAHAFALEPEPTIPQDLIDAATREGQVVWYETSAPSVGDAIAAEFGKRFPGITLRHVQVNTEQIASKILQEVRMSVPSADVMQGSPEQVVFLNENEVSEHVDWQSYGLTDNSAPTDYAVATASSMFVLAYNTDLVPEDEVPATWEELGDPKWKDRISALSTPQHFGLLTARWGEEKTTENLKRFVANGPRLFPGNGGVVQAIISGETPIGVVTAHGPAAEAIASGAPIAIKTLDPTPVNLNYSTLIKNAAHPNAGKLLLLWLNTDEGALVHERASGRGTIYRDTEAAKRISALDLAQYPLGDMRLADLLPGYAEILRGAN